MNYLLLTTTLASTRLTPDLRRYVTVNFFKDAIPEVDDNYFEREEFGFYTGDTELALGHAMRMLRAIRAERKEDANAACKHLVDSLFDDLDRFLRQCLGIHKNADNLMRSFFALSVELGYMERIPPLVETYYREYFSDAAKDDRHPFALDYEALYEMLGDYVLFGNCDAPLAMRFYRLADLDWFLLRDSTTRSSFELDEGRKNRLKHYHEKTILLQELYAGTSAPEAFAWGERGEAAFWGAYFAARDRIKNAAPEQAVEIAQTAEACMFHLTPLIKADTLDAERFRNVLIAVHGLRRDSIFQTVYALGEDTPEKCAEYGAAAIAAMSGFRQGKQGLIGKYIDSHHDDPDLADRIFWLCEAVQCVECIKSTLLVQKPKQDMAYYTSIDTMLYMMPEKAADESVYGKLSVMHIAYMNDPNEGKTLGRYLLGSDASKKQSGSNRREIAYPFVFMKCFTSLVDDLPMWEMYGNRAQGCCIVMDWEETLRRMPANAKVPLYRICYITDAKTVNRADNPHIANLTSFGATLRKLGVCAKVICRSPDARKLFEALTEEITYLFKNSDYSHEQELRILYHKPPTDAGIRHTAGDVPLLYVQTEFPVCIKEIIMGPKSQNMPRRIPYIQQRLHTMCEKTATPLPRLSISAIEYI